MPENAVIRYTDPETVQSPKASISSVRVLMNTGQDGFSVAALQWEGEDRIGIRWNGGPNNPMGNPQSRGIPTWFIAPDEVAAALRSRYGDALGALSDQNSDITRVRIRPLPLRFLNSVAQDPEDYEWVLSITDPSRGQLEIMNPATGHYMAVDRSQIKALIRDSTRDAPTGPKHGFLELNVQMIFEDSRLRLEPLQSLSDRVRQLAMDLTQSDYASKQSEVNALITEARVALTPAVGPLGPWEAECLDYADAAVRMNFLRLALTSVDKAIAVNKLRPDEYEYGFYNGRAKPSRPSAP